MSISSKNLFSAARCAMRGSFIHSVSFGEIEVIEKGLLIYSADGIIEKLIDLDKNPLKEGFMSQFNNVIDNTGKIVVPGFIDAHCHAPQYTFTGTGMDLPLLQWLEKYTFPAEARFKDVEFARTAYEKSIRRHLKCGTTFASYFATIHNEAGKVLVDVINQVGQRAFVGKVSMDRNSPDFYVEDTESGCDHAEDFVQYVLAKTDVGKQFLQQVSSSFSSPEKERCSGKREKSPTLGTSDSAKRLRTVSLCDDVTSLLQERVPSVSSDLAITDVASEPAVSKPASFKRPRALTDGTTDGVEVPTNGNGATIKCTSSSTTPSLLNKAYTPLVMPCITPRFVPTCTSEMMAKLGEIALRYGLPVQSHLSESVNEIKWVAELHPDCENYAAVYEKYGLLGENVFMAHCCHSDRKERELLVQSKTGVVHCANSNFMLNSGTMDARLFKKEGLKVALGTDVAGGYSPSMLDAMRQAIVASKCKLFDFRKQREVSAERMSNVKPLSDSDSDSDLTGSEAVTETSHSAEYETLNYKEAFHLATVGGAEVLHMDNVVGNFLPGKKLDCLVVDIKSEGSPIDVFDGESTLEHFQKFLFLGDDRNIVNVMVDGKQVL